MLLFTHDDTKSSKKNPHRCRQVRRDWTAGLYKVVHTLPRNSHWTWTECKYSRISHFTSAIFYKQVRIHLKCRVLKFKAILTAILLNNNRHKTLCFHNGRLWALLIAACQWKGWGVGPYPSHPHHLFGTRTPLTHISKISRWAHWMLAMLWINQEVQRSAFNSGFSINLRCVPLVCAL